MISQISVCDQPKRPCLSIWQKRPIYIAKETYLRLASVISQHRLSKETYLYGKRGLSIWQKKPTNISKPERSGVNCASSRRASACAHMPKETFHLQQKRPDNGKRDLLPAKRDLLPASEPCYAYGCICVHDSTRALLCVWMYMCTRQRKSAVLLAAKRALLPQTKETYCLQKQT